MKATVTTMIIAIVMLMASSNCCMIIDTSAEPAGRLSETKMKSSSCYLKRVKSSKEQKCLSAFLHSPNKSRIKGFLNCSMYFLSVLSSSGALSSLYPIIFDRLSASCHDKPNLRLLCKRRSISDIDKVADSAVDSNISFAKFKPSA